MQSSTTRPFVRLPADMPALAVVLPSRAAAPNAMRLWLAHLHRRAVQRRAGALHEGRLRYLLKGLAGWRRQLDWLGRIATSPILRAAAQDNPRLYERWQPQAISRALGLADRARVLEAHYAFIGRLPERLASRLARGHDVRLATLPLGGGQVAYLHARTPECESCGELGLVLLNAEKEVVSSCAMTFAGPEGVLIGAMRGSWAYLGRREIARFIRASGGLSPRALLLAVVQALASRHGFSRVRGVSAAAHALGRKGAISPAAYDRFWQRHGGTRGRDGFWDLPPGVPSAGAGAQGRVLQDACEAAARAFGRPYRSDA
jgi:uncharacterized protein